MAYTGFSGIGTKIRMALILAAPLAIAGGIALGDRIVDRYFVNPQRPAYETVVDTRACNTFIGKSDRKQELTFEDPVTEQNFEITHDNGTHYYDVVAPQLKIGKRYMTNTLRKLGLVFECTPPSEQEIELPPQFFS